MKRILGLLAALAVAACLTGCQKTPDSPVVIGKDYGQMMKLALSGQKTDDPLAVQIGAAEKYVLDGPLKNAAGNLEVCVDADVIVPDTSKMTVARVSRHSFTSEECRRYIEVLFGGQKTYSGRLAVAKPALQRRIEKARAELEEAIAQKDEKIQALLEATLKKYEQEMASYGEGDGLIEAPVEFTVDHDNYDAEKMYLVSDGSDGTYRSIRITNHEAYRTYELICNVSGDGYFGIADLYSLESESELHFGTEMIGDPGELPAPAKSRQEAVSDAEKLLSDLGLSDFCVKNTDTVFGNINGRIQKAYRVAFTRTLGGVSFNYSYTDLSSGTAVDDGKGGKAPVWGTEKLTLIVTDEGVVQLEMLNPLDVNGIVTEYAKMKDFESITDIFKRMILIVYANVPEGEVRTIEINRIELGLMRILEPDSLDTGVIVPVWDFYGPSGETYLTINAIDGSIIDRSVGY